MSTRVIFIVNPAARGCPADISRLIEERFPDAAVLTTERAGDAGRLAEKALSMVRRAEDTIVACGGDGTVREVAGVVGREATIGILPLGTVNQVAGQLGIPSDVKGALSVLSGPTVAQVYPGTCVLDDSGDSHLFFIGVSAGPDADAVMLVRAGLKKALGSLAYGVAFLERLFKPVEDSITCRIHPAGGAIVDVKASEAIALAGELYAGRFCFSDSAALTAPGLVLARSRGGRGAVFGFFLRALFSRTRPEEIHPLRDGTITMKLEEPGVFQIDGDHFTARKAFVAPCAKPLFFRVPAR